jgi:hypothetical protein
MDSAGQAVEARRAPLEEVLKALHHAMTQLEENGSALEGRLGRIIARGPENATVGSLHLSGGANKLIQRDPPEPRPRSEMTMELTELTSRVRQAAERLRNITHALDC